MSFDLGPIGVDWNDLAASQETRMTGTVQMVITDLDRYPLYPLNNPNVKSSYGGQWQWSPLSFCSWCHCKTTSDDYGHCLACGGPRS